MDFDDRLGVSACIRAYAACWNQHDISAMSRCFCDDAMVVDSFGVHHLGRDGIRDTYLEKHNRYLQNFTISMDSITIEPRADGMAQAHCMWTVRHQQNTERDDSGVYRLLLERQDNGRWLIKRADVIR